MSSLLSKSHADIVDYLQILVGHNFKVCSGVLGTFSVGELRYNHSATAFLFSESSVAGAPLSLSLIVITGTTASDPANPGRERRLVGIELIPVLIGLND